MIQARCELQVTCYALDMRREGSTHVGEIVAVLSCARVVMAHMNWPAWCPGAKAAHALTSMGCTPTCKYFVIGWSQKCQKRHDLDSDEIRDGKKVVACLTFNTSTNARKFYCFKSLCCEQWKHRRVNLVLRSFHPNLKIKNCNKKCTHCFHYDSYS